MKRLITRALQIPFAPRERSRLFAVVVTALFFVALLLVHQRHEAWRDEVHCWSVGRNSAGLWDLMFGDRRYDGHPFLWYYAVYLVSRVVPSVAGLHVLTIGVTVAAAYLWVRHSGAPRIVRLMLLPSYLFFYEYGTIGRSYILGALMLFAFCTLYRPERVRYVSLSLVLIGLALTSVYGAIMSGALAMFLFTRGVALFRRDAGGRMQILALRQGYLAALGVYLLGIALTAITTMPPPDEYWAQVWYWKELGVDHWNRAFGNIWWSFAPANYDWTSVRWLGVDTPRLIPFLPWMGATAFVVALFALRRAPMLALSFGFAILVIGYFTQAKYPGGLRHVGNNFLFLLACLWLLRRELGPSRSMFFSWGALAFCLFVQIKSTRDAVRADWSRPFSGGQQTAQFLTSQFPADTLVIGVNDFIASTVAGYANHSFIFAETGDYGQSVVSHNRRWSVSHPALLKLAKDNLPGRQRVLVLLNSPFNERDPALDIIPKFKSAPSIVTEERYFLYEVRPKAP